MTPNWKSSAVRQLSCLLILGVYAWMIDLKGLSTDEGFRLWIINGGHPAGGSGPAPGTGWKEVIAANSACAYQPLYFLLQNSLMHLAQTHSLVFFRLTNLVFLWIALQGLLALSRDWRQPPRLFLLGLFSFNAYLFMHVLQIREYIAGVAFYIWTTWLVLRLDSRKLGRSWADVAWFSGYGGLLVLGFFLQTWTVFPAIGQGLFLLFRRRGDRTRFLAHLALAHVIVIALTWPYLQTHQQKVNVGLWATEQLSAWSHVSDGFHLVLAGHLAGHSRFTDFLFWFWLAVIAGAAGAWLGRGSSAPDGSAHREIGRQGGLMILCVAISLAFQIGYALRVENLSLWPRYFVIHYFFLTWLIALAFNYLFELGFPAARPAAPRLGPRVAAGGLALVLAVSAVFQVGSYRRDPMFDTSQTLQSNWRVWAAELSATLQPGDVVLMDHFISQATLTFTRPLANRSVLTAELATTSLDAAPRLVCLEGRESPAERDALIARAAALGFKSVREQALHAADGRTVLPELRLLIFTRE